MMKRCFSLFILVAFTLTSVIGPNSARAQGLFLPQPGTRLDVSPAYMPVMMKGLKVNPDNPLLFDFIMDTGKSGLKTDSQDFKAESEKLIKYFLASLTIKEDDLWVNLSPYEQDRMITDELGGTELGRDMLAQDYVLKQLTASMIYPENNLGKEFWAKVYAQAQERFGSTDIPVDTFNKVWITADKAKVLERNNTGYVVGAHLKVLLDADYMASQGASVSDTAAAKDIIRQIILPAIEQEVNEGQNFANLRQMFYAMILSTWYKQALKDALLNQVYANKAKTSGVQSDDPVIKEKIYAQYLEAYKKGVFDYIKEDVNQATGEKTPRKYFSGGLQMNITVDRAQTLSAGDNAEVVGEMAAVTTKVNNADAAQGAELAVQKKRIIDMKDPIVTEWHMGLLMNAVTGTENVLHWDLARDISRVLAKEGVLEWFSPYAAGPEEKYFYEGSDKIKLIWIQQGDQKEFVITPANFMRMLADLLELDAPLAQKFVQTMGGVEHDRAQALVLGDNAEAVGEMAAVTMAVDRAEVSSDIKALYPVFVQKYPWVYFLITGRTREIFEEKGFYVRFAPKEIREELEMSSSGDLLGLFKVNIARLEGVLTEEALKSPGIFSQRWEKALEEKKKWESAQEALLKELKDAGISDNVDASQKSDLELLLRSREITGFLERLAINKADIRTSEDIINRTMEKYNGEGKDKKELRNILSAHLLGRLDALPVGTMDTQGSLEIFLRQQFSSIIASESRIERDNDDLDDRRWRDFWSKFRPKGPFSGFGDAAEAVENKMTLDDVNWDAYKGKTVAVRVDYNVPVKDGVIKKTDESRIQASLETINFLVSKGVKVILTSHLGKGDKEKDTLAPVADRLQELMGKKVIFNKDFTTVQAAKTTIDEMKPGDVLLLENVRFNKEETSEDAGVRREFAKKLFTGVDLFVLDGFSVAHREQVSVTGAMGLNIPSIAGKLVEKEIVGLKKVQDADLLVMGGIKVSDKIKIIEKMLLKNPELKVLIGGGMANAFFVSQGGTVSAGEVGVDEKEVAIARDLLVKFRGRIILRQDAVIASKFGEDAETRIIDFSRGESIPYGWIIVDIGPKTSALFKEEILKSKVVFGNFVMGAFDKLSFAQEGTKAVAEAFKEATAKGVFTSVGGGDTVAAAKKYGVEEKDVSYMSMAGGATLEYLETDGDLPGTNALSGKSDAVVLIPSMKDLKEGDSFSALPGVLYLRFDKGNPPEQRRINNKNGLPALSILSWMEKREGGREVTVHRLSSLFDKTIKIEKPVVIEEEGDQLKRPWNEILDMMAKAGSIRMVDSAQSVEEVRQKVVQSLEPLGEDFMQSFEKQPFSNIDEIRIAIGANIDSLRSLWEDPTTLPETRDTIAWVVARMEQIRDEVSKDAAENVNEKVNGGIDLNAKNMGLDVDKAGKGIEMTFDPAMIEQFRNGDFSGVVPVILKITPIQGPLQLLGLDASGQEKVA